MSIQNSPDKAKAFRSEKLSHLDLKNDPGWPHFLTTEQTPSPDLPPKQTLTTGSLTKKSPAQLPIDLEIGCGVGMHPIAYARAHPNRHLIAIEQTQKKFHSFARRLQNHPPLNNLTPVQADAVLWISRHVPPQTLDKIFILYPNPYPKTRQANLRWANRSFMGFLLERLKAHGQLIFATNIESYAEETTQSLISRWGMTLVEKSPIPASGPFRTHFEKKYCLRGQMCWNLVFNMNP